MSAERPRERATTSTAPSHSLAAAPTEVGDPLPARSPANGAAANGLLILLGLLGTASLALAVRQALRSGIDLQWSGARLLGVGIDPWKTFLSGDPGHQIILGQQPNYLHELYVLLLPLGKLGFHQALIAWCLANLLFLACSVLLTARLYGLSRYNALALASLLCLSAPLRVTFANGQQSVFALCCFAIAYSASSLPVGRGFALGIGFAKYSMAPVVVVVETIRRRWISLLCAGVPIVAGLLLCWRITGTRLPELLFEPLRSAQIAVSPGYGDLMTILQLSVARMGLSGGRVFELTSAAGLLCALAAGTAVGMRRLSVRREVALVAVFTLFCFKHLIYDYVFLLFPLATWLQLHQHRTTFATRKFRLATWLGWGSILYLLLSGTVESRLHLDTSLPAVLLNGVALLTQAFALWSLPDNSDVTDERVPALDDSTA